MSEPKYCQQCERVFICKVWDIIMKTMQFTRIHDTSAIANQCVLWKQMPWEKM